MFWSFGGLEARSICSKYVKVFARWASGNARAQSLSQRSGKRSCGSRCPQPPAGITPAASDRAAEAPNDALYFIRGELVDEAPEM